eukprot:scaffold69768_cov34-Prasinocladus_malaysianus.AAC.2
MAAASCATFSPSAALASQSLGQFRGDEEGMVDLLVDACVRAKELQRQAAELAGSSVPRAGRDLVPYFTPGSSEWGLEDVNSHTDDSDASADTTKVRLPKDRDATMQESGKAGKTKGGKSKKAKRKVKDTPDDSLAVAPLLPATIPVPYAGTAFGNAAPPPESLPMPSQHLLAPLSGASSS